MKVIYQKTMIQKLQEAVRDANMTGKKIEKVLLTKNEVEQLKWELSMCSFQVWPHPRLEEGQLPDGITVVGLKVERDPQN